MPGLFVGVLAELLGQSLFKPEDVLVAVAGLGQPLVGELDDLGAAIVGVGLP